MPVSDTTIYQPTPPTPPQSSVPPSWKRFLPLLASFLVALLFLAIFIYFQTSRQEPLPTLPPADPPPPPPLTLEEQKSVKHFVWDTTLPENLPLQYLYTITSPLVTFDHLANLISLLGFTDANLVTDSSDQKVWANALGTLSAGSSPQYFLFHASEGQSAPLRPAEFLGAVSDLPLSLSEPENLTRQLRDRETGETSELSLTEYSLLQELDGLPVLTDSRLNIGTLTYLQDTNSLIGLNISGGYRQTLREGTAPPLSQTDLEAKAESSATLLSTKETISDRQNTLVSEQNILVTKIIPAYYHNSNDSYIRPGYLLTGLNQDRQTLHYFVPSL